ncbi:MAG: hypothetical protein J3K34DRAFT_400242 [Monoraphidium minutum]|nr:MAG: hypothetical protein J3K34DRAFT_400242 [Monoraphidium minutum]
MAVMLWHTVAIYLYLLPAAPGLAVASTHLASAREAALSVHLHTASLATPPPRSMGMRRFFTAQALPHLFTSGRVTTTPLHSKGSLCPTSMTPSLPPRLLRCPGARAADPHAPLRPLQRIGPTLIGKYSILS